MSHRALAIPELRQLIQAHSAWRRLSVNIRRARRACEPGEPKMRTKISAFLMAALIVLAVSAQAHEGKHAAATVTGELVDTGCYLGHMGQGASHVGCATKCINGGMPMGVLTSKGMLYLVTMNHDNADPYNKLKSMAGKKVAITGQVFTRAGMKAIEVTSFKPAG
jgi:hypothetical protein